MAFKKRRAERERIEAMAAELGELRERLAHSEAVVNESQQQLTKLNASNLALRTDVKELGERADGVASRLVEISSSLATIDDRTTSISTQLRNQLDELGGQLDAVDERSRSNADGVAAAATTDDLTEALEDRVVERMGEAIDDVHTSQERLAAEQARYQMQFRRDLAELADRLRRPPTG